MILEDSAHTQSWNCYTGIVPFHHYSLMTGETYQIHHFNLEMHLVSYFAVIILYQCTAAVCSRWCCTTGVSPNQNRKLSSSPFSQNTNIPCKERWLLTCCRHNRPKVIGIPSCDTKQKSVHLDCHNLFIQNQTWQSMLMKLSDYFYSQGKQGSRAAGLLVYWPVNNKSKWWFWN